MELTERVGGVAVDYRSRRALIDGEVLSVPILDQRVIVGLLSSDGAKFSYRGQQGRIRKTPGDSWGRLELGDDLYIVSRKFGGLQIASSDGQTLDIVRRRIQGEPDASSAIVASACAIVGLFVDDIASPSLRLLTQVGLDRRPDMPLRPWFS